MEIAVIKTGGKQYIVSPGQKVRIEKLETKEGEEYIFDQVLLYKKEDDIKIGNPFIKDFKVVGKITKQDRDKKVIVFKYKPKKRYKIKRGHRQLYTEVEIIAIKNLINK